MVLDNKELQLFIHWPWCDGGRWSVPDKPLGFDNNNDDAGADGDPTESYDMQNSWANSDIQNSSQQHGEDIISSVGTTTETDPKTNLMGHEVLVLQRP